MLPGHGWIRCRRCFSVKGDEIYLGGGDPAPWRLEANSAAWGSPDPEVIVLGFSKGARQSRPLPFEAIPFAGMWPSLTKILRALKLLESTDCVERHFRPDEQRFHFGSLIRCSVSGWDRQKQAYSKSGGQILERFLKHPSCHSASVTCARTYLGSLPDRVRLVLMLGNSDDYIQRCMRLMESSHPGIRRLNAVSYGTDGITWVHALHPAAQGSYLADWLGRRECPVGRKFAPALEGVMQSGVVH